MHSGRAFVIINTQSDIARCQPDGFYQVQGAPFHVSIQAQVINLFQKIQKELGITYVFIAHDLAVVRHIADKIAVMYLGHIVETMDAEDIFTHPMHPYTKALLSAVPITVYDVERSRQRILLEGEVPSPLHAPKGCPFNPRCTSCKEICKEKMPALTDIGGGHFVACHLYQEKA